ncbi:MULTISPECIES: glutathione S-transferase N-terminal domain-containing protein [unclassified Sinorhizobium]|uniref:glutathione S-transferase N-terminal domain-containing protein n=1 Tax=unclassified Sinorhizobium TaxID=2613772 RepID=UPI0035241F1C
MKLYMHPAACSLSAHIVCRELGLDIELIEVQLKTHKTVTGDDYLAINGAGYVPALMLDDGKVLTEGPAIVQFLAESAPEGRRLLPETGTFARSQVQSYLNFVTAELHKPMVMLLSPAYAGAHDAVHALVSKRLEWLNGRLAGPYLTGDSFTVADAYLFVCLNWSPWMGIDLRQWPALDAFMAAVRERPRVRQALQAEELEAFEKDGTFFASRAYLESAGRTGVPVRP